MNMTNNITFTSKITPLTNSNFSKITSAFNRDNFVGFPWDLSNSRIAKDVFTNNVQDCSVCLLTDGDKALLMHLMPFNEKNYTYSKIYKLFENNFDLNDKNLQAVLLGSKPTKPSQYIYNLLTSVLNNLGISTTVLKTGKSATSLAYRTCKDEIFVANKHITKALDAGKSAKEAVNAGFETVIISPADVI